VGIFALAFVTGIGGGTLRDAVFLQLGTPLGMYAAIGVQKSLDAHVGLLAAVIVGVLNAVGGGVIRDVLAQRPAMLFQPSQIYGLAALAGCLTFVAIVEFEPFEQSVAGACAVVVTVALRMLAVRFNWRTRAITVISSP
jgi:uncharacterized membrane protein YeiH